MIINKGVINLFLLIKKIPKITMVTADLENFLKKITLKKYIFAGYFPKRSDISIIFCVQVPDYISHSGHPL